MANGWTPERKARQAALIRTWKPWEKSTGARTATGKAASSQNACVHRLYDQESRESQRRINALLKECKELLLDMKQEGNQR